MYQDLKSFRLPTKLRGRNPVFVQFWWIFQALIIGLSPQVMYGWRRFWFRIFGAKIGTDVLLRPSVRMTYPWKVAIGDYSWLGDGVELYSLDTITIGSNVVVSQNTYICTGTHDYGVASFDMVTAPICIKDQAWVASDVFIHPGVTIGEACVVGARSTVGKDLPAGMLCVGSPCEVVRSRHA